MMFKGRQIGVNFDDISALSNVEIGIDKLTRIGRKWSSVGHCYPDAVAATRVAIAVSLRWRSVQRLIRWRWTLNVL